MRGAIVLSGQYRSFDKTWEKIKSFIDYNQLDVYCHLWEDVSEEETERQYFSISDKLSTVKIIQQKQNITQFLPLEQRVLTANPKPLSIDKIAQNAAMNYSRKQAFDLIDEDYDTIVYCRYDLDIETFGCMDVPHVVTPFNESYNLVSDIFAIMPHKDAKHYFIYDNYEKLHSTQFEPEFVEWLRNEKKYPEGDIKIHMEQRYCPHMMLLRNLVMNKVAFSIDDIPVSIHR